MEFTFDIRDILQQDITKISNTMIPPGFAGDRRKLWDTQKKLSDIINAIGEASASAQGLTKPITTADRLKNSDHQLYLLVDHGGRQGSGRLIGLLKTGRKGLYIFDRSGQHYQLHPVCILDFYVHEAVQRMGLGKRLFEHMLKEESCEPVKLAIDRPSEKFLGFLKKHYNLNNPIPQMNNFVVFDGFFPEKSSQSPRHENKFQTNNNGFTPPNTQSKSQNGYSVSPFGRYAAPRPICSMGQIIHNHSPTVQQEHSSDPEVQPTIFHHSPKLERPRSLSINTEDTLDKEIEIRIEDENSSDIDHINDTLDNLRIDKHHNNLEDQSNHSHHSDRHNIDNKHHHEKIIPNQHYSTENNIIPAEKSPTERITRTPTNLTEQGFIDLKFYHSRLW